MRTDVDEPSFGEEKETNELPGMTSVEKKIEDGRKDTGIKKKNRKDDNVRKHTEKHDGSKKKKEVKHAEKRSRSKEDRTEREGKRRRKLKAESVSPASNSDAGL